MNLNYMLFRISMALTVTVKHWFLALSLISLSVFCAKFGKADETLPQTGGAVADPSQIVAKALICFNENYIYSNCEETYRLTESGNLDVPSENTEQYCTGPCQAETNLVLTCIDNLVTHFEFYNKATIQDVRGTIKAGCGNGSQRGNFNVAEHIQAEGSKADKIIMPMMVGVLGMILVQVLLF